MIFLIAVAVLGCVTGNELPSQSINRDPNTQFIMWGTRHGNRQPEKFLEENPRTWGFEGATELSSFGKRQGYGLGQELRRFVGNLMDTNYNASQAKYYSSSANRCQMTLQVAQAGLYIPSGYYVWDSREPWSPVPYSIDDPMLRMYSVPNCPNSDKAWAPITDDELPHLAEMRKKNADLINYCQQMTGWNMTNLGVMADLADNLIEIDLYNASYPTWIENPTLKGYNSFMLKNAILNFSEIHQIACAEYEPCRQMMSVYWLQNIIDNLQDAANGKSSKAMVGYAGHTETTLSLMKQMGIVRDELTTSAGFVIEFRKNPSPSVRLLNHDPNPIDQHVIYRAQYVDALQSQADQNGFIPLSSFINYIQPMASSDWKKACGAQDSCSGSSSVPSTSIISLFIIMTAYFL